MTTRSRPRTDPPVPPVNTPVAGRWGVRARVAEALIRMLVGRIPVDFVLPDGRPLHRRRAGGVADEPMHGTIVVHRPEEVYRRVGLHPKVGIGESYTAGDWDAAAGSDLAEVLVPFAERLPRLFPRWLVRWRHLVDQPIPDDQRGARQHTGNNIAAHYDLSNDMFAAFLDPTLSYSAALFDPDRPVSEQSLQEAQLRKVEAALDLAGVQAGTTLLEIGTGWGTLAIEAARRGAQVTTVTLSREQAVAARARIEEAGLGDRVEVVVSDYREVAGTFDAIVSIEMIEAVGERYWPDYFAALAAHLRPGGVIALQSILMSHERYLATRHSYGWIQKHIFPGGLIPSMRAIEEHVSGAGLRVTDSRLFGADYAETLHRWRTSFQERWPTIRSDRFGDDFRRTWEFYLAYCEAGFRTGYLEVAQLRIEGVSR